MKPDVDSPKPSEAGPSAEERIVAAAIQSGPVTFTGPHHATIIHYVARCTGIKPVKGEQGFVTSKGRFVSRLEAVGIALAAGQVESSLCSHLGLMSENLWLVPEDSAIAEAKRSAHLEDARAGCRRYCAGERWHEPKKIAGAWIHVNRMDDQIMRYCQRPEAWDALSLLGKP